MLESPRIPGRCTVPGLLYALIGVAILSEGVELLFEPSLANARGPVEEGLETSLGLVKPEEEVLPVLSILGGTSPLPFMTELKLSVRG